MTKQTSAIIYFTRYPLQGSLGGGGRRALQIINEFSENGFYFYTAGKFSYGNQTHSSSKKSKGKANLIDILKKIMKKCLIFFLFYPDYFKWRKGWRDRLFWFWSLSQNWKKEISKLHEGDIVLIEDPYYFKHLINHLKKKGIRIVALPQNIESLFFDYCQEKYQLDLLRKELHWLQKCELVVTISREEFFLLNNKNIKVLFHPYYPPENVEERFLNIRKNRSLSKKEIFLLLGNAGNNATKTGMIELIDIWKKNIKHAHLWVIGYNTECLRKYADGKIVIYKGSLMDHEMDDLLTITKAVICYQKSGPGALTRVAEMLIANIPVVANVHAVRSYSNIPGIFEFHSVRDLVEIIGYLEEKGPELDIKYNRPESLEKKIAELFNI